MSYSAEQLALEAHIKTQNAKAREEGCCILPVDEIDHWAKQGITTIEQYEHFWAVGTYIDVYKEIYGIKPRWLDFSEMTAQQVWDEVKELSEAEDRYQQQRKEMAAARKKELAHNNRYRPNNALAGLGDLLGASS